MTQKFKIIDINNIPHIRMFTKNWIIDVSINQVVRNDHSLETKNQWLALFTPEQKTEYLAYEINGGLEYINFFIEKQKDYLTKNPVDFSILEKPSFNFILR